MNEQNSHIQASKDRFLKIHGMDNKYDNSLINSVILINGASAIALFAFIGSIWPTGLEGQSFQLLSKSLSLFAGGVGFAVISKFFRYFSSCICPDEPCSDEKENQKLYITICNKRIKANLIFLPYWTLIVIPLLISFACFTYGVGFTIDTFYNHLSLAVGK